MTVATGLMRCATACGDKPSLPAAGLVCVDTKLAIRDDRHHRHHEREDHHHQQLLRRLDRAFVWRIVVVLVSAEAHAILVGAKNIAC